MKWEAISGMSSRRSRSGVSLKTLYNRLAAYQNSEPKMIAL